MKKLSLVIVFVTSLFLINNVNATGVNTDFSDYKISSVDNFNSEKNVEKVWVLEYSSSTEPITVVKRTTKSTSHYVVKSPYFEVSYAANSKGFGVEVMRNSWRNVPEAMSNAVLNSNAMEQQSILTPNQVDDEKALGLIASYLPELLNESYKHLLN